MTATSAATKTRAHTKPGAEARASIPEQITASFIELLEQGVVPWHKPWQTSGGGIPLSMSTGRHYQGMNAFVLGASAMVRGYRSPYWGTFRQIQERGGQVRKGEHGTAVIFYKPLESREESDDGTETTVRKGAVLKSYYVFSAEQCDGLPEQYLDHALDDRPEHERIALAEIAVAEYLADGGPALFHGSDAAYYNKASDSIHIADMRAFDIPEEYYSTLFHELGHSTGHGSRLNRVGVVEGHRFGDPLYAAEELIAEMTSAMSCAYLGIDQATTLPNSAAYIQNWLGALRNDSSLLMTAAAGAQRACQTIGVVDIRERHVDLDLAIESNAVDAPEETVFSELGADPLVSSIVEFGVVGVPEETVATALSAEPPASPTIEPTDYSRLDDYASRIWALRRSVHWAETDTPEKFAWREACREMGALRQQAAQPDLPGADATLVTARLEVLDHTVAVLNGQEVDDALRDDFIEATQNAHANDSDDLRLLEREHEEYRAEVLAALNDQREPWQEVVISHYGVDGLVRVHEWREAHSISDPDSPFAGHELPAELERRLAMSEVVRGPSLTY